MTRRPVDTGWLAPLPPGQPRPTLTVAEHLAQEAARIAQIPPQAAPKPPAARSGWISVQGRVRAETERAVVARIDGRRSGVFNFEDVTFPRSVCDIEIIGGIAFVSIPPWLAKKKGFSE